MGSCIMPSEKHNGTLSNLGVLSPTAITFFKADFPTRRSENGSHFLTPGKKKGWGSPEGKPHPLYSLIFRK